MLVGPPGSFKSFLAIDWALSLAVGRPWGGRAVKPSKVLYALGEGKASLLKRIQAWIAHAKLTKEEYNRLIENFIITFDVPQLAIPREAKAFIQALDEGQLKPTLLVIDTLARSYVGKNENDQLDAGVWVDSVEKLRHRGMTILTLHHTKKNVEFGLKERGSGVFLGAMDTSYILEKNPEGYKGYARLFCTKQKDHEEPEDIWMQRKRIAPNPQVEGSIVLVECTKPGEEEAEARAQEEAALQDIITSLLNDQSFTSDRARAKALAEKTNILEATAQTKIHRAKKKFIEKEVNAE